MHPILFEIGPLAIGTYGVIVATAVFCGILLGRAIARKEGLSPEIITDFFVYSILAGFVGAKIALVIGDFEEFSERPLLYLLHNFRSFGAFYGGFVVALLVGYYYVRKKGLSFWEVADIAGICLALTQGIGRWGCFFAGCCHGSPTNLPWGMVFPAVDICADGARIHPWPIYESILDFSIFAFLFYYIFPRRRFKGQAFILYTIFYALGRGLLEFMRGDSIRGLYFNGAVSLSQILAVCILLVMVPLYFIKKNRARNSDG